MLRNLGREQHTLCAAQAVLASPTLYSLEDPDVDSGETNFIGSEAASNATLRSSAYTRCNTLFAQQKVVWNMTADMQVLPPRPQAAWWDIPGSS